MNPVETVQGDSPIVLGLPHTGTHVPVDVVEKLNENGLLLADTDWHVDRLYDGLLAAATIVRATFHRYVIDANRDPGGGSLYPGQNTTGLVPLTDFDGRGIWREAPESAEISRRLAVYHAPYHAALRAELERVRSLHGVAILYDCHSIRSRIPFLFEGRLPAFNIGTNQSTTCAPGIERTALDICSKAKDYKTILNGRFKGGWTTRHYGNPSENIHAIQMELAQSTYLTGEAPPWNYDTAKSARLRVPLTQILTALAQLAPNLKGAA
jgi:N-formylglutamate deformylase